MKVEIVRSYSIETNWWKHLSSECRVWREFTSTGVFSHHHHHTYANRSVFTLATQLTSYLPTSPLFGSMETNSSQSSQKVAWSVHCLHLKLTWWLLYPHNIFLWCNIWNWSCNEGLPHSLYLVLIPLITSSSILVQNLHTKTFRSPAAKQLLLAASKRSVTLKLWLDFSVRVVE